MADLKALRGILATIDARDPVRIKRREEKQAASAADTEKLERKLGEYLFEVFTEYRRVESDDAAKPDRIVALKLSDMADRVTLALKAGAIPADVSRLCPNLAGRADWFSLREPIHSLGRERGISAADIDRAFGVDATRYATEEPSKAAE